MTRILLYRRHHSWHAQVVSGRRAGRWLSRVGGVWRWMPRMPMGPLYGVGEITVTLGALPTPKEVAGR